MWLALRQALVALLLDVSHHQVWGGHRGAEGTLKGLGSARFPLEPPRPHYSLWEEGRSLSQTLKAYPRGKVIVSPLTS